MLGHICRKTPLNASFLYENSPPSGSKVKLSFWGKRGERIQSEIYSLAKGWVTADWLSTRLHQVGNLRGSSWIMVRVMLGRPLLPAIPSGDLEGTHKSTSEYQVSVQTNEKRLPVATATLLSIFTNVIPLFMCWMTWSAVLTREALAMVFMDSLYHLWVTFSSSFPQCEGEDVKAVVQPSWLPPLVDVGNNRTTAKQKASMQWLRPSYRTSNRLSGQAPRVYPTDSGSYV